MKAKLKKTAAIAVISLATCESVMRKIYTIRGVPAPTPDVANPYECHNERFSWTPEKP